MGYHVSHDLQLLIDHGDVDALAALSDHTADTDGWDTENSSPVTPATPATTAIFIHSSPPPLPFFNNELHHTAGDFALDLRSISHAQRAASKVIK